MTPFDGSPAGRARLVLVIGCLAGILGYLVVPFTQPGQFMLASDVYHHAVTSLLSGEGLYEVPPPGRPGTTFLYPPIAAALFLPHALIGSHFVSFAIQTALNVAAALGTAVVIYRALQRRGYAVERLDLWLIAAFMVVSVYSAIQFINGQVNLWLAFALAVGFDAMDRDRQRLVGVAFAAAALVKVFPAVLGLWLVRLRAWRAVAAAVVTGLAGLIVGAVLFGPELTLTFFEEVLLGRFEGSTYEGRPSPDDSVDGVHRQLAAISPGGSPLQTVLGLVIVGTLVLAAYQQVDTPLHRDVAALATIVGVLLFLPLQPLYYPLITFPLLMLLYARIDPTYRPFLWAGTVLTFVHVDIDAVEVALAVAPVPTGLAEAIRDGAATVFTFILPPTAGLWVLLFTCVLIQWPSPDPGPPEPTAAPADD